jgi:hypothetical protein
VVDGLEWCLEAGTDNWHVYNPAEVMWNCVHERYQVDGYFDVPMWWWQGPHRFTIPKRSLARLIRTGG